MKHCEQVLTELGRLYSLSMIEENAYRFEIQDYTIEFYRRDTSKLVVAFNPRSKTYPKGDLPWGVEFLRSRGLSGLHVKPSSSCWYRGKALEEFFRDARDLGLFDPFQKVMNYGGSMGGFGALSFAGLTKATSCLAHNPQVNLGPTVRGWEDRWPEAEILGWDGELCDVTEQTSEVRLLCVVLDPYHFQDNNQVSLIKNPNTVSLHLPFVGHRIPGHLQNMRMLKPLFQQVLDENIDFAWFRKQAKRRRGLLRYRNEMLRRTESHPIRQDTVLRFLPSEDGLLGGP